MTTRAEAVAQCPSPLWSALALSRRYTAALKDETAAIERQTETLWHHIAVLERKKAAVQAYCLELQKCVAAAKH